MANLDTLQGKQEALNNLELRSKINTAILQHAADVWEAEVVGTAKDNYKSIAFANLVLSKVGNNLANKFIEYIIAKTDAAIDPTAITDNQIQSAVSTNFVDFANSLSI